jgi:transposase
MIPPPLFVGIEVAKAPLAIAVRPTAETWSVPNEATGIDALVARLRPLAPTLLVREATGG